MANAGYATVGGHSRGTCRSQSRRKSLASVGQRRRGDNLVGCLSRTAACPFFVGRRVTATTFQPKNLRLQLCPIALVSFPPNHFILLRVCHQNRPQAQLDEEGSGETAASDLEMPAGVGDGEYVVQYDLSAEKQRASGEGTDATATTPAGVGNADATATSVVEFTSPDQVRKSHRRLIEESFRERSSLFISANFTTFHKLFNIFVIQSISATLLTLLITYVRVCSKAAGRVPG